MIVNADYPSNVCLKCCDTVINVTANYGAVQLHQQLQKADRMRRSLKKSQKKKKTVIESADNAVQVCGDVVEMMDVIETRKAK